MWTTGFRLADPACSVSKPCHCQGLEAVKGLSKSREEGLALELKVEGFG